MTNHTPQFTPEETAQHITGLQHSVDLIDLLISEGIHDEETHDTMDRNVRHIGIMCGMTHLQSCGTDLSPFLEAQSRGVSWMSHPIDQ